MKLTKSEQKMFDLLAAASPETVSIADILLGVYGPEGGKASPENCIKVFACRIRKQLSDGVQLNAIRGKGYQLVGLSV